MAKYSVHEQIVRDDAQRRRLERLYEAAQAVATVGVRKLYERRISRHHGRL
jgi:hypothetical protein